MKLWTLNQCWRFMNIQIGYFIFGLGSLILAGILIPLTNLLSSPEDRHRRVRFWIRNTFALFIGFLQYSGVLKLHKKNMHLIRPGSLVLANHPSLLDIVFLFSFIPNANCVVKSKLLQNPFTRFPILSAGYIVNDDPESVINEAHRSFNSGEVLIVFPEGTRTKVGQPLDFKRGASQLAVRTAKDVTPVIIDSDPPALTKESPWFSITEQPWDFTFTAKPALKIQDIIGADDPVSLQARRLTKHLQGYFTANMREK